MKINSDIPKLDEIRKPSLKMFNDTVRIHIYEKVFNNLVHIYWSVYNQIKEDVSK